MNPIRELRSRTGMTQAELARRAGTSQPTVAAYERGTKSPTLRTLDGMAAALGLEVVVGYVRPLTREDRRSLALHRAIAKSLVKDPHSVLERAHRNLAKMSRNHPGARRLFVHWRALLSLNVADLCDVLVDPRAWARDLRQVTPFAGVLSPPERAAVYRAFGHTEKDAA